ncbi:MAG: 1-phosphofructokinase family hexose kinase [Symbiobacteriia bacterium]
MIEIATVTLNPSIDRTVRVDGLWPGGLHRVRESRTDAAGKGVNVARACTRLGEPAVALGILAGDAGRSLADLLRRDAVYGEFVWVEGETRTNLKLLEATGRTTQVNEVGPRVTVAALRHLEQKLAEWLPRLKVVVISGSLPPGAPPSFYGDLVRQCREAEVFVVLDADGDALRAGLAEGPDLVKPNREEAERLLGRGIGSGPDAVTVAQAIRESGAARVVVSLGDGGCAFSGPDGDGWAGALRVPGIEGTTGAGDTLVAGLVAGWLRGLPLMEAVRLGVAAASSSITHPGPARPDPHEAEAWAAEVQLHTLRV